MNYNNGLLPIYQLVLKKLCQLNKPYIFNRDIENIVINMKINKKEIDMKGIKKELALLGFTKLNIDKICNHIFWKMRYTLGDTYEIKRNLIKKGFLETGSGNRIFIKNKE